MVCKKLSAVGGELFIFSCTRYPLFLLKSNLRRAMLNLLIIKVRQ